MEKLMEEQEKEALKRVHARKAAVQEDYLADLVVSE